MKSTLLATLLLSRGTPMLAMGDELGRTQRGNNNAYAQDNALAWIDWEHADRALADFVRGLIELRRRHPALHADRWLAGLPRGVIRRAEQILEGLEKDEKGRGRKERLRQEMAGSQMGMFAAPPTEPRQSAVLRELAAWREEEARRCDRPRERVLPDASLLRLARARPRSLEQLRGTQGLARRYVEPLPRAQPRPGDRVPRGELTILGCWHSRFFA
jgi:superfamily II DNA helicase RecQ